MSDLTHGLSALGSVIRAGDDLRISFTDTSSLKRGITQLKSDEVRKSDLATVTFFRPRGNRKKTPRIPSLTVSNYSSGGSIGHTHAGRGLTGDYPMAEGVQRQPCFEPCCLHVLDHRVNIKDTLTPLETEQVARIDARAGAKRMKRAEMLSSVAVVTHRLSDWSVKRTREYFDWAKQVVDQICGSNVKLERRLDYLYRRRS